MSDFMELDHFAIAVRSIDEAYTFFEKYLNITPGVPKHQGFESEFNFATFNLGSGKIELVESTRKGSFVEKFIEKRGEGMHHFSIYVDDMDRWTSKMKADGVRIVDEYTTPIGWRTAFISPRSAFGVLIQLWQPPVGQVVSDADEIGIDTGITEERSWEVKAEDLAGRFGNPLVECLGTPRMIAWMEETAATMLASRLPAHLTSVGSLNNVRHHAPTLPGMQVRVKATLRARMGRHCLFGVQASDPTGRIGEGTHERFIVDLDRFRGRIEAKARGEGR